MEDKITILFVDDEFNNLSSFKVNFQQEWNVLTASSGKEGLEILRTTKVQVIISDYRMPDMTGIEFLEETIKLYREAIRILISDQTNVNTIIDAVNNAQIYYYLKKPWDKQQVSTILKTGCEAFDMRLKNKELIKSLMNVNAQMEMLLRQDLT